MELIDGKKIADAVKQEIASEVAEMVAAGKKRPHLAAILVGHDGGSETYVAHKVKACEQCGFESTLIRYEADVTEAELLEAIARLNADDNVDGFIVQLPLPKHIDEQKIIEAIDYRKDVDGFHPINVGRLSIGLPCFLSATPQGILELLRRYNVPTKGANCVVLGRSNIVGKPALSCPQHLGGQAGGFADDAESGAGRCYCDSVPQPYARHKVVYAQRRHHHRCSRSAWVLDCRYGERRRYGYRCGHYACAFDRNQKRFPPERRCRL